MTGTYFTDNIQNNNIYETNYLNIVKNDEMNKGKSKYEKSKNTFKTGVVPLPSSSSMFSTIDNNTNEFVSLLSGEKLSMKEFQHNNMQPFIKGNVTQNTNIEKFSQQLDNHTGVDRFYQQKREVENMYKPVAGFHNINGAKPYVDFYKNRMQSGLTNIQNNISPIDIVYVGPGLNQGYDSRGIGGFQQTNALDYARPKTIDEIRSKVNQKNSIYEIPFQAPPKATEQRGIATPYAKNRPERIYNKTHDQLFKTTGAYQKDTSRPELSIKRTYRPDTHHEYAGVPTMENQKGMSIKDDYGKNNIIVYDNERQETETKTNVANVTSIVKSIMSPLVDAVKFSIKEYMVDAPRAGGNPSAQIPNKLTTHDPNDMMKTTVKETLIHDGDLLNLTGPDGTYSAAHDIAKTTVKETLIHDSENLNVKGQVNYGHAKNEDIAKKTLKETLPVVESVINVKGRDYRGVTYDPDNMKVSTTVKETTIKGRSELGFIGGILNGIIGGYATNDVDVRNSHKQFTVDNENIGIAQSMIDHRQTSREADENTLTTGARETLLINAGHTPNAGRMNIPIDKDDVNVKSNKLITDSYAARDAGNVGVIYQTSPELNECSVTRDVNNNNAYDGRLDGTLLSTLHSNDYSININPIIKNTQ